MSLFNPNICDMNIDIHPNIYIINQIIQDNITCTQNNKSKTSILKTLNKTYGVSIYKLNQLYQYQLDNLDQSDSNKDIDYMPYRHITSQPIEGEEDFTEYDDVEKDPDYVASDSEEDQESTVSSDEEDNDSSSDYEPSDTESESDFEQEKKPRAMKTKLIQVKPAYESDEEYVPSDSEYDSEEFKSDEE